MPAKSLRFEEDARRELLHGVDALAITEHLEYQPHRADIPNEDRNKAFEEAKAAASDKNIIIIKNIRNNYIIFFYVSSFKNYT